jgi:hypothetical protein
VSVLCMQQVSCFTINEQVLAFFRRSGLMYLLRFQCMCFFLTCRLFRLLLNG